MKNNENGPGLLILGQSKAGTDTLFNLLNTLPEFSGSQSKELRYFSMDYYYHQGPEWYHSQFDEQPSAIKFEATPHYLYFPAVAARVDAYERAMQKEMKFIVLLREPAARCYSAWNMERSFHQKRSAGIIEKHYEYYNPDIRESLTALLLCEEFPSFQQSVSEDIDRLNNQDPLLEPSYVRTGMYARQITHWLKWFDMQRFLFLEIRELSDPFALIEKLEEFLHLKISNPKLPAHLKHNVGDYPTLSTENRKTIEMLKKLYSPHNEKLFEMLGKRFDWND